jgi:hypothetical protein
LDGFLFLIMPAGVLVNHDSLALGSEDQTSRCTGHTPVIQHT